MSDITTTLDRWITFLTKAYEYEINNMPEELSTDPHVKKAIVKLSTICFDKKEQEIYEAEQKVAWDEKEKIRTAEEKGIQKGVEKGKIEAAKIAKVEGIPLKLISKMTGLSEKEIKELYLENFSQQHWRAFLHREIQ